MMLVEAHSVCISSTKSSFKQSRSFLNKYIWGIRYLFYRFQVIRDWKSSRRHESR